ncbi:hypothetical protein C1N58_21055 (plasmid) [Pantoea sp. SGAir0180]
MFGFHARTAEKRIDQKPHTRGILDVIAVSIRGLEDGVVFPIQFTEQQMENRIQPVVQANTALAR